MEENALDVRDESELLDAFAQANIVLHKDYLELLENEQEAIINPAPAWMCEGKISKSSRFYNVKKLSYNAEENVLDKLSTVFNADYYYGGTLAVIIQNDGKSIQYYLGAVNKNGKDVSTNGEIIEKALRGNFSGSDIRKLKNSEVENLFEGCFSEGKCRCISAVSGVASDKIEDLQENKKFVQGLEKLIDATVGEVYTLVILADPLTKSQMQSVKNGYEVLYSQLAPFEKTEMTFNSTDSVTLTEGTNKSFSDAINNSVTQTTGTSYSESTGESISHSYAVGKTKPTGVSLAGKVIGAAGVGVAGLVVGPAAAIPAMMLAGSVAGLTSGYSKSNTSTDSSTTTSNVTEGRTDSHGETHGRTKTNTEGTSESTSLAQSHGQTLQITSQNRNVKSLLDKIDQQLERFAMCENFGMFNCAAYVISSNPATNHIVASTYSALMRGEESGVETSAVNTWYSENVTSGIAEYLKKGYHPEFYLLDEVFRNNRMLVSPASMVSGRELALHMGLPKKSVPGLAVVETAEFGRNVYRQGELNDNSIALGDIYHMGNVEKADVRLDVQSMAMHTFVTGSTGTGKSNTVYQLLGELERKNVGFLVIEPAKGEYKHMFGNRADVAVFGTNPYYMPLLKINPFKFPKGIHVLEHVDRLVEIFNVCWPMYAAMPAVLKDAVLRAYEASGWNLITSINQDGDLFPSFEDVLRELNYVIENSAYSADTKGDYIGSLATRLNSLTNGLNGQMFVNDEVDSQILFDGKTIVDLSRVGSLETKALLMGVLVMRLSEHRMADERGMNQPLRHVTVLEEAHNILKRTSTDQNMEGSNMAGKSVEMISNAIAEMRTYGEGFIIADQSPNAIDISAIRNTNTKIIMRLPDEDDRKLAGRSAALKDEQLDEIAKLPKGVAVVYQNDWLEPVLCKIQKFAGEEQRYQYDAQDIGKDAEREKWFKWELLKLLIKGRVNEQIDIDIDRLQEELYKVNISTQLKRNLRDMIDVYQKTGTLEIWQDKNFGSLSAVVIDLLQCKADVERAVMVAQNFEELDQALVKIIHQQCGTVSNEMQLALSQCLLRQRIEGDMKDIKIYSAWQQIVKKRRSV